MNFNFISFYLGMAKLNYSDTMPKDKNKMNSGVPAPLQAIDDSFQGIKVLLSHTRSKENSINNTGNKTLPRCQFSIK